MVSAARVGRAPVASAARIAFGTLLCAACLPDDYPECETSKECPGAICHEGFCRTPCVLDDECGEGGECEGGVCREALPIDESGLRLLEGATPPPPVGAAGGACDIVRECVCPLLGLAPEECDVTDYSEDGCATILENYPQCV